MAYFTPNPTPTGFTIAGLSKEDAYIKIATEISRLESQISSLYSLRNSLSPVSSIPNELLSKIFMNCCELDENGRFTDLRYDSAPQEVEKPSLSLDRRLVLSWVSRRWRNVALAQRSLWNMVICNDGSLHSDYARACRERCRNLSIDAYNPAPNLLQLGISRASHLVLSASFGGGEMHGFTWPHTAPLLQSLKLTRIAAHVVNGITPGMCPQLHTLELRYQPLDFDWNFFPRVASTLANLTIIDPPTRTTTAAMINLLQSLPLLTTVEISSCLRELGDGPSLSPQSLPQLQTITISEAVVPTIQLLRNISATAASIHIRYSSRGADIGALFHTLQARHGHVWDSIHHLWYRRHKLTVSSSSSEALPITLMHSFFYEPLASPPPELLVAFQTLNLSNLESFWTEDASAEILDKLCHLTELRKITLAGSRSLLAFITYIKSSIWDGAHTTLFPAMQELTLVGLDSKGLLLDLYTILTTRKVSGVTLQKLVLVDCSGVETKYLASFKKAVDEVELSEKSTEELFRYGIQYDI